MGNPGKKLWPYMGGVSSTPWMISSSAIDHPDYSSIQVSLTISRGGYTMQHETSHKEVIVV